MKNPPEMVKTVMAAVCVMKGVSPDKIPDPNKPGQKVIFNFTSLNSQIFIGIVNDEKYVY